MKFEKTPIALAVVATAALAAAAPFAHAAPSVSFSAPAAGATLNNVTLSGTQCAVSGSNISRVVFAMISSSNSYRQLNIDTAGPFSCTLDSRTFANGTYTLRAMAYDSAGASATALRQVTVANGAVTTNTPPTVSVTAPASGATVSGTAVSCGANASDSNGVSQVQFFLDGAALNTDTASPYTCSFNSSTLTNGTHTLRATATDSLGATNSSQVSFNVSNGTTTNPVPVVTFTRPANGATVPTSGSVGCTVTASDADGIRSLQWYLDGRLVNTELSAPYDTCNINNLPAGSHVIRAVATDNRGNVGESQITVNAGGTTSNNPAPVVTFTRPASGASLPTSGAVSCTVTASDADGIRSLQWYLDGRLVNTEYSAPYDTCNINNLTAGTHVIRAVATDNRGGVGESQITVTAGSATTNTPPSVSITTPTTGATLSGSTAGYSASAADPGGSVAKVDMYVIQGTTPRLVDTKTTAPYQGTINTTTLANGAATVRAVATDNLGATSQTERSVTISNSSPTPTPDPDPGTGGTGTSLPSTNARAIATFESIGLYWSPGSNPGSQGCEVRYRKKSESAWKQGLNMWYDSRNSECRGSLVHLTPGTDYVVEMARPGQAPSVGLNTKTWSENFPIARTVNVSSGSGTLRITEGGTPSGYVLYTGPATLDAANSVDYNVQISAPYVIVRGLTLRGARVDGIRLEEGSHDVVIEDNDISGWGRDSGRVSSDGWRIGVNRDSAVSAFCRSGPWLERVVIQRNKMHDPRYGTNSWSDGHPSGPNGVLFSQCGGNHVFRFNEIYSSTGEAHYLMDAFGGEENFSDIGFPNADTDINGNIIRHTWDDGVEAEGANRNVRIWGNYVDSTAVSIATTVTHVGPAYVFRNVYNRSRMMSRRTLDTDERNNAFKSGTHTTYGKGRRYVFHNTLLQPTQAGVAYPLGAGGGLSAGGTGALTNTVSRNNILHIWKSWWQSINTAGGTDNDLDYDLRNGSISAYAGAETNGIVGTPVYAPGHGWQSEANGQYQLAPSSPGFGRGARLPNFNDSAAVPDMGAHQSGTPAMNFGVGAASGGFPTGGTTTAGTSGSSSSTGGTTTTAGGGGVCSTLVCAVTTP
jgi:hypothetical protein